MTDKQFARRLAKLNTALWDCIGEAETLCIEEYVTPVGKFLPEEWLETAKRVVEYNGLTALYEKIKQHYQTQCVWLKTEKQIEEYALSCMANHAYKCWKDFMEVPK